MLAGSPARADCQPDPAVPGGTVTCSGTDNNGFDSAGADNLNVTVQTGATISVGDNAKGIVLDDNSTANNIGSITAGANGIGIEANNGNTVTNNGTISVGAAGVGVQFLTTGNTLNNYGLIQSTGNGFSVETCVCTATNNTINNFGTLDGRLEILGVGQTVNNRDLITITDTAAGTPLGGFTHTLQNTTGGGAGNTFNQFPGGTLALRMNSAGTIDSLIADAISPGGTLRVTIQPGLYPTQVTSGTAISVTPPGTITAPFASYVASSPFFTVTPVYSGGASTSTNYTDLNLQVDRIAFNQVGGLTLNQRAISDALEGGYSTTLTGNAATFYGNLLAATSTSVFDLLSGEGTAATQGTAFGAGTLFQSAMLEQSRLWLSSPASGAGAPLAYASERRRGQDAFAAIEPPPRVPAIQPWQAWASGFGRSQDIDGDAAAGSADASVRGGGAAIGVNYSAVSDMLVGASIGGSASSFSVTDRATSGELLGLHIGAYGLRTWGAFYAAGAVSYSRYDNDTTRNISGVGSTETATGDFTSDLLTGRFEAGWRRDLGHSTVTPFAAIQVAHLWQRAYTETSTTSGGGTGILGLSYQALNATSLPLSLGMQVESRIELENGRRLLPFVRVAWVHEFNPAREIEASFVSVPSASFTAEGPRVAKDAAKANAGAWLSLNRFAALFANFDGEFSSRSRSYSGSGGFSMTW